MEIIPYGRQKIEDSDIEAVVEVLQSDFLTQGPTVQKFEDSVTQFLKGDNKATDLYGVAVTNGTAGLHLACLALGLKRGDKVLVTSNSFAATANCALYVGADVDFVDINLEDFCIDITLLEQRLEQEPKGTYKGVIAVDFAGIPLDLKRLRSICDRHGLWLIEDACHALGAKYKNGTDEIYSAGDGQYADIAVLSFHPVKHIATGEGGMLTTRSKAIFEKLKLLRSHGITKDPSKMKSIDGGWYYEMQELGFNYRISDILCALGASQMKRIEENLRSRQNIAKIYDSEFRGLPIHLPKKWDSRFHAYHLYVIRTEGGSLERKALYEHLIKSGVYPQVHYIPIYRLPFYVEKYGKQSFSACDSYYESCLSLPMFHSMTEHQQEKVISTVKEFFQ